MYRSVFIAAGGFWASGHSAVLNTTASRVAAVIPPESPEREPSALPNDLSPVAREHLSWAANWRQAAAGLVPTSSFSPDDLRPDDPAATYARAAVQLIEPELTGLVALGSGPVALVVGTSKGPFIRTLDSIFDPPERLPPVHLPWLHDVLGPLDRLSPTLAKLAVAGRLETRCVVAACATGLRCVIDAARLVAWGQCDCAIAIATDASIHPLALAAYEQLGVLSPRGRCDAWLPSADGFFVGEGAAVIVLTARPVIVHGPSPVCIRLAGWHSAADPGLVTGDGTGLAIKSLLSRVLARAGWDHLPADIKPHGTGTPLGDRAEQAALAFPRSESGIYLPKRRLGHTLGAAGIIELVDWLVAMTRSPSPSRALTWSAGFGGSLEGLALERSPETAAPPPPTRR